MRNKSWLVGFLCWVLLIFSSGISLGETDPEVLVLRPDADGIQRAFIVLDSYEYTPSHVSVEAVRPLSSSLKTRVF